MPLSASSWKSNNSPAIFLVAVVTGVVSGLICVALRFGLRFLQWLITGHSGLIADAASYLPLWRRSLTPVLGAIAAAAIMKASQRYWRSEKTIDYIEGVRFFKGRIPFRTTLWSTVASAFSIASGAAIGREGSMIQFAAASIASLGLRWRGPAGLDRLVALGTAAAVASVYQAPLAGVFFTIEIVLGMKAISKAALMQMPALLVSASAGAWMSHLFLGKGPLFAVATTPHFKWQQCLPVLAGAVIIGGLGPAYFLIVDALKWMKKLPWAMVWSGVAVGVLSCLRPETWGNGDSGVLEVLGNSLSLKAAALLLVLRLAATAACVGSGVIGGVFTPTIFVGSVLGLLYGHGVHIVFAQDAMPVGYAVLGISCLLASATQAPFMAALMTVELTGTWHWFPIVLLGSLVAFQTARTISPRSLYAVATPDPGKVIKDRASKDSVTSCD